MVICKLCNQSFQYINNAHLWFKHHMTQKAYLRRYGGSLKSEEYKAKAYKNHSFLMSWWRKNGAITPPPPTPKARQKLSQRMTENNPMFYPEIVKKVQDAKQGNPSDKMVNRINLNEFEQTFKEAEVHFQLKCADCGMTEETHIMKYNRGLIPHDIPYPDNPFLNQFLLCIKCSTHEIMRLNTLKKGRRRRKGKYLIEPITYIL